MGLPTTPARLATTSRALALILLTALLTLPRAAAAAADFSGEWRTSFGIATLKQTAGRVTGTYGDAGQFTLEGTATRSGGSAWSSTFAVLIGRKVPGPT